MYSDFNFWVFNYYKDHNIRNEVGCLAIDEYDYYNSGFKGFFFKEINQDSWVKLIELDTKYRIPLYFGLIGLQCLASTVVDDNKIREALKELAGIQDLQFVDNSFKESFNSSTIQDELWTRVRNYLDTNYSILIEIPLAKKFKDRYLQYPKSQVVLNKNDLTEYIPVFEKIHEKFKVLTLTILEKEIKNANIKFNTKNNKNETIDFKKQRIKFQQAFNYYNSDDWQSEVYKKKIYKSSSNTLNKCYLYFENEDIQLFNSEDIKITPNEILSKYGEFCFFKKLYDDEFERIDYLEWDETYIILYKKSFSNGRNISGNLILEKNDFGFNKVCFKENEPIEPYIFSKYINPIQDKLELEGLRISRQNIFLRNLGPKIICKNDYNVYHENLPITYDNEQCLVGNYRIKRAGYSDVKFVIANHRNYDIENNDLEASFGWRIDNLSFDNSGSRLVGAKFIEDTSTRKQELTINEWITTNRINSKQNQNQYLTLLSNYLYGK